MRRWAPFAAGWRSAAVAAGALGMSAPLLVWVHGPFVLRALCAIVLGVAWSWLLAWCIVAVLLLPLPRSTSGEGRQRLTAILVTTLFIALVLFRIQHGA